MLKGKVALITGASKGIGKECAKEFSKNGAFVIIHYNTDKEGAIDTLKSIKEEGGFGLLIGGDLSSLDGCCQVVKSSIEKAGKIDILVNNAGISKNNPFIFTKEEDIQRLVDVNINSFLYMSYYISKHMINNSINGVIINIGSIWGEAGASNEVVYSLTKGAMHVFTKALGKELGPSGIRVLCLAPGVVDTSMNDVLLTDELADLKEDIPLGRFCKKEEIAKFAAFLASDGASYANAKVFLVDGGIL